MRHASLTALFVSCAVVVGTTLALPVAQSTPHTVVDARSGHHQLCEAAKAAAAESLDTFDFEGYRGWQSRIRASCLAAAAP